MTKHQLITFRIEPIRLFIVKLCENFNNVVDLCRLSIKIQITAHFAISIINNWFVVTLTLTLNNK